MSTILAPVADRLHILARNRYAWLESLKRAQQDQADAEQEIALIEMQMRALLEDEHIDKIRIPDAGITVAITRRRDVRIVNAEDFAAALIENGMDVPMTAPKPDTRAMKEIAKKLPDWPGAEPFETVSLKVVIDA